MGFVLSVGVFLAMPAFGDSQMAGAHFDVIDQVDSHTGQEPTSRVTGENTSYDDVECSPPDEDENSDNGSTSAWLMADGTSMTAQPKFWRCCKWGYKWRLKWYYDNDCQCRVFYLEKVKYCKRKSNLVGIC